MDDAGLHLPDPLVQITDFVPVRNLQVHHVVHRIDSIPCLTSLLFREIQRSLPQQAKGLHGNPADHQHADHDRGRGQQNDQQNAVGKKAAALFHHMVHIDVRKGIRNDYFTILLFRGQGNELIGKAQPAGFIRLHTGCSFVIVSGIGIFRADPDQFRFRCKSPHHPFRCAYCRRRKQHPDADGKPQRDAFHGIHRPHIPLTEILGT